MSARGVNCSCKDVQRCAKPCEKDPAARVLHMRLISDSNSPCASGSASEQNAPKTGEAARQHSSISDRSPGRRTCRCESRQRRPARGFPGCTGTKGQTLCCPRAFHSRPAGAHRSGSGLPAPGQQFLPPATLAVLALAVTSCALCSLCTVTAKVGLILLASEDEHRVMAWCRTDTPALSVRRITCRQDAAFLPDLDVRPIHRSNNQATIHNEP